MCLRGLINTYVYCLLETGSLCNRLNPQDLPLDTATQVLSGHAAWVHGHEMSSDKETHIAEVTVNHAWACQCSSSLHSSKSCRLWPQLHTSCGIAGLVLLLIDVYASLLLQKQ